MPILLIAVLLVGVVCLLLVSKSRSTAEAENAKLCQTLDKESIELDSVIYYGSSHIPKSAVYELICLFSEMRKVGIGSAGLESIISDMQESIASDKISKAVLEDARQIVTLLIESDFTAELSHRSAHQLLSAVETARCAGYVSLIEVVK